jgi:hypothetical protein
MTDIKCAINGLAVRLPVTWRGWEWSGGVTAWVGKRHYQDRIWLGKVKVKVALWQAMKTLRRNRGIALLFLSPWSYRWVVGQRHAPADLPPVKKTRNLLYKRLGVPQGRSGRVRKCRPQPWIDPWTAQSLASRNIEWAIAADTRHWIQIKCPTDK